MTSLRCLLAKVFMEKYCPTSSPLRRKTFFFILPWFTEKVLCHGSWQTSGCLLMPRRQDHGHPFCFSAGPCTAGSRGAALSSLSLLLTQVAVAEGPWIVRNSRGFPHRKALPPLLPWKTSIFHRPKPEPSRLKNQRYLQ